MDQFTKTTHLIPLHTNYRAEKYAKLYLARILCLHGVPKTIILTEDPSLLLNFGSNCMLLWGGF
jgi:hypothetical protein